MPTKTAITIQPTAALDEGDYVMVINNFEDDLGHEETAGYTFLFGIVPGVLIPDLVLTTVGPFANGDTYISDTEKDSTEKIILQPTIIQTSTHSRAVIEYLVSDVACDAAAVTTRFANSEGEADIPTVASVTTDGTYRVCVLVTDAPFGLEKMFSSPEFIRDTTAPDFSFTLSLKPSTDTGIQGDTITNSANPILIFNGLSGVNARTDVDLEVSYIYQYADIPVPVEGDLADIPGVKNGDEIPLSAAMNAIRTDVAAKAALDPAIITSGDGIIQVTVKATNSVGNQRTRTSPFTVIIDTTPPVPTFTPADGGTVTNELENLLIRSNEKIYVGYSGPARLKNPQGDIVESVVTLSAADSRTITIDPAGPLADTTTGGRSYTMELFDVTDLAGNSFSVDSSIFRVQAPPKPSFVPSSGIMMDGTDNIIIDFTEEIFLTDGSSINVGNNNIPTIILRRGAGGGPDVDIPFTLTWSGSPEWQFTLDPDAALTTGATYTIRISRFEDANGLEQPNVLSSRFVVGAPRATFTPADGTSVSDASVDIIVVFDHAIYDSREAPIRSSNAHNFVTLKAARSTEDLATAAATTYNSNTRTMTIDPASDLPDGDYTLIVNNVVDQGYSVEIVTQAGEPNIPQISRFTVDTTDPFITINPVTGDDLVDRREDDYKIPVTGVVYDATTAPKTATLTVTGSQNPINRPDLTLGRETFHLREDFTNDTLNVLSATGQFGRSVAVGRTLVIVGAPAAQNSARAVYVLEDTNGDGQWGAEVPSNPLRQSYTLDGNLQDIPDNVSFGSAVAISPDDTTIVVGAKDEDSGRGAVYIYTDPDENGFLDDSPRKIMDGTNSLGLSAGDQFGSSVAVEGTVLIVGADSGSEGAVYVFKDTDGDGDWTDRNTTVELLNTSTTNGLFFGDYALTAGDKFGHSVAVQGNLLVVGAPGADRVYLFEDVAHDGWRDDSVSVIENTSSDTAFFGASVVVHDHRLFIGASGGDDKSGVVFLLTDADGQLWKESLSSAARVESGGGGGSPADSSFGASLAFSPATGRLFVGAPGVEFNRGAVRSFSIGSGFSEEILPAAFKGLFSQPVSSAENVVIKVEVTDSVDNTGTRTRRAVYNPTIAATPNQPTGLSATVDGSSILLSWDAPTLTSDGIIRYQYRFRLVHIPGGGAATPLWASWEDIPNSSFSTTSSSVPFSSPVAVDDAIYEFQIRPVNQGGNGRPSDPAFLFLVKPPTIGEAVSSLNAEPWGDGQLKINWTSPTPRAIPLTYQYQVKQHSGSYDADWADFPVDASRATLISNKKIPINAKRGATAFSTDGAFLYTADATDTGVIYQYRLSVPWQVATIQPDAVGALDMSEKDTHVHTFSFSPDGTNLYVIGEENDNIYQYTLSNAWDISSAVYTASLLLSALMSKTTMSQT